MPNTLPLSEKFDNAKGEVVRKLSDLRDNLAERTGQERYKILQVKTINYIAEAMPQTLEELTVIKGIGPKKLKELGPAILAITRGGEAPVKEKSVQLSPSGERLFTVGEFLDHINEILYAENLFVQGEISSANVHPSGVYLTLKDKKEEAIL